MESKNLAIEFIKWCNTPIYRASGSLSSTLRVTALFPDYNEYIVIDESGRNAVGENKFLTAEELFDHWYSQIV